jgi:UPF0755 protein
MRQAGAALLLVLACGGAPGGQGTPEIVVVPPGASLRTVADSLAAHGVIDSRFWFRTLARLTGASRRLQSGSYALARGAGARAALAAIRNGRTVLTRFTVPEGLTLLEIAELAERELRVPRDSFLAAARDPALLREFGVPAASFEGFLRPETYLLDPNPEARHLVRTMAEGFQAAWDPGWDAAAAAQGFDRLALVTLGSIIEGEAQADSERALIAAVYRNRMRIGMPLQADATVQYAIQQSTGRRKPRLYEKDYGTPSPYNTYLRRGLPPGPIGAPSSASLAAVLAPAPVPFLYYVAGPDGRHVFSRTYAEHLRAIRAVRAGRR